jgi:[ribosomal protein S5]-alanine N-acetyltransferase
MKNNKKYELEFESSRLILKRLEVKHSRLVLGYKFKNFEEHKLALPDRQGGYFQERIQKIILEEENDAFENGTFIRLYIFAKEDTKQKEIIGDINIGDIKLGNISNCLIGIKIDSEHLRMGYAQEALETVIDFLFGSLNLHSITANILPDNYASLKLFEKLGFEKEGLTRHHMKTGGQWRDHIRYSLIKGALS